MPQHYHFDMPPGYQFPSTAVSIEALAAERARSQTVEEKEDLKSLIAMILFVVILVGILLIANAFSQLK